MMLTGRIQAGIAILSVALCWQSVLNAADTPLAAIPARMEYMIRAAHPGATLEKLIAFAGESKTYYAPSDGGDQGPIAIWTDFLREYVDALKPFDDAGVDGERDWWLFIWNDKAPNDSYAIVVPTSDAEAFQAYLALANEKRQGEPTASVVYKSWVIYGTKSSIDSVNQCLSGETKSMESRLDSQTLTVFNQGDVGIVLDAHAFASAANGDVEGLAGGIGELCMSFWEETGLSEFGLPTIGFEGMFEAASHQFWTGIAQSVMDGDLLTVSLSIDEDAIRIENHLTVKADSATAAFFKQNPGSEMDLLAQLPTASAIYLGLHGDWKSKFFSTGNLLKLVADEATGVKLTEAQEKRLKADQELKYGTTAIALPMHPVEQGLLRSITIREVDAPDRARELALDLTENPILLTSAELLPFAEGAAPQLVRTTEKYGPISVDVVTKPNVAAEAGAVGGFFNFDCILYGSDDHPIRTVYLKDRIIESVGGSKVRAAAAIRQIVEASGNGAGSDETFMSCRGQLHKTANLILMADMGNIAAAAMQTWNSAVPVFAAEATAVMKVADQEMDEGQLVLDGPKTILIGDEPVELPRDVEVQAEAPPERVGVNFDFNVAPDEEAFPKFDSKEIERLTATRSMIGCSVSFEPQAGRIRIVLPKQAVRTVFEATGIIGRRIGVFGTEETEIQIIDKNIIEE